MSRAMLMLLAQPRKHEECAQFEAGLHAAGYSVHREIRDPKPGDVLVVWNRAGLHNTQAKRFEAAKATVLVAENGYLGSEWRGERWYALAKGHHNGRGRWPAGGPERWDSWGVKLAPMRTLCGETVVLAQRGIGEPSMRAPDRWADDAARRFRGRIRRHPGATGLGPTLEHDLRHTSVVVTWSSGAAIKAMLAGCWCWHGMPGWIAAPASTAIGSHELLRADRRLPMLQRLAWAQWSASEVCTALPWGRVLAC